MSSLSTCSVCKNLIFTLYITIKTLSCNIDPSLTLTLNNPLSLCVSPQSLFHANSLQKTHQSALQVQQKAEVMLQAGHFDPDGIRACAEKVAMHWQQLMLKMEDRLKLVNASVAFYKTSEQVCVHTNPT